ncbi:uncharacterized protein LOC133133948 isoform X2 [Conger conger]|uniref:uncharacterized protein LOC133133948 isoform X2 n=1 Tax=Conger conger TaxID=82655 RepID=UPI002A59CD10|nr:uncharacterized protein LOC133133948 isoform X2 [Conger conger]
MGESIRPCLTWMLMGLMTAVLGMLAAGKTMSCSAEKLNMLTRLRGDKVNIHCPLPFDQFEAVSVTLMRSNNRKVCTKTYNNNHWMGNCARYSILWNNETKAIYVSILELQINDSDIYTCEVSKMYPPDRNKSQNSTTSLCVTARPTVTVSQVEGSSGPPLLVCVAHSFYPGGAEQVWLRDGQHLNVTPTRSANMDGTFSLNTSLSLSSEQAKDEVFTCWVNHSTLSQPITFNYTLSLRREKRHMLKDLHIISIVCGTVFVGLIIVFGPTISIQKGEAASENPVDTSVFTNCTYTMRQT